MIGLSASLLALLTLFTPAVISDDSFFATELAPPADHETTDNSVLLTNSRYSSLTAAPHNADVEPVFPFNATEPATPELEKRAGTCFPALGFTPPPVASVWNTPNVPLNQWKCAENTEVGFFGFSYAVDACQSEAQLVADFTRMRTQFGARYVRTYGWCDWDNNYFPARLLKAAYDSGIGVYYTIWFGFDGTNDWMWRRDTLLWVLDNVPLARYVVRSIDVGSEPLFDWAIDLWTLHDQVWFLKSRLNQYQVQIGISEMKWGYEMHSQYGNAAPPYLLAAVNVVHPHNLPFFDWDAGHGSAAWPSVKGSTDWFRDQTGASKKIVFTQTGWPTDASVWPPNSPNAEASVGSAKAYLDLLDSKCEEYKSLVGGVGWFWHIWKDAMLPGWGLLDWNENPKYTFAPRTSC